jgi:hypothetical protein
MLLSDPKSLAAFGPGDASVWEQRKVILNYPNFSFWLL